MSAMNKMAALKAAFEKKTSAGGEGNQDWKKFFQFWRMPDDSTAVIRFLPDLDEDTDLGFLVENLQHDLHINGNRKNVPCLQMWGEKCPICDLSRKYYDDKNEQLGKKYYRKKSYIGQCIVIESPIEHDQSQLVKLIDFGPAIFKQIQAAFQSGDLEEAPYELKGGYNFRIKKTKNGQYASYSTSSFAPKQTDLDDEIIESLTLFNLADYRGKRPELATIEALLVADQTGQSIAEPTSDGANESSSVAAEVQQPSATPEQKVSSTVEATPAAASGTSSVLDRLRQRQAAKQND